MHDNNVTYYQQVSYCGKPHCRKCREGVGHGPYWYAYQTVNGRTIRTYIGKELPPSARELHEAKQAHQRSSSGIATDAMNITNGNSAVTENKTSFTPSYRFFVLGQVLLERRQGQTWHAVDDAAWQQPGVRALLGYLVSNPGRKASRAQLIEALWPDDNRDVANEQLSTSIRGLRQVLTIVQKGSVRQRGKDEQAEFSGGQLLHSKGEELRVVDQRWLWVDATAFEEQSLVSPEYSGDFFPEERQAQWAIVRREALRQHWAKLLLAHVDQQVAQGAFTSALDMLDRLLTSDPASEAAIQRLIRILARLGRRGEALRAYQRFAALLQREYGTVPSNELRALYESVRKGEQGGEGAAETQRFSSIAPVPNEPIVLIGRTHQSVLVGREQELATLRDMLLHTEQYRQQKKVQEVGSLPLDTQRISQAVFLMGEAGIGKTRLAEEMSHEAQRHGWLVLWSRVYAQESGIPYRLWIEILRRLINSVEEYSLAQSANALHASFASVSDKEEVFPAPSSIGALSSQLQPLTMLLPELQHTFATSTATLSHASGVSSVALSPEQEQFRLWEATRELLTMTSRSIPLLVVLDDIQWADVNSCELFSYLARHIHGYPILLVGTCRENEISSHPLRNIIAHMQREHSIQTIPVTALTSEQIGILVSAVPDLPEALIPHIQAQSQGNPFFAEELARMMPPETTLPKNITATLESRLNKLSVACQRLLGNAAVLGGSFELPVICSMESGEASATSLDEDTILDLLEEAIRAGVLTEEGRGTHITYSFWHTLQVNHLYERVSATRRKLLHRRAATILQRMYGSSEEEIAATITNHLVRGGAESPLIVRYATMAGDRAYTLLAYPEVEQHYRLVVAHTTQHEQVEHSYVIERLAECTMIQGDFVEARRLYEQVLTLHNKKHTSLSDRAASYEAQVQALVWGEIGRTWSYAGDKTRAQQCYTHGEHVLREAGVIEGPALARLRFQQSSLYWQEGRYEEAQHAAQEALTLFEQQQAKHHTEPTAQQRRYSTRIQRTLAGDLVDLGRTHRLLGALANGVGQRDMALTRLNTALAIHEQYDHRREIAHVSCDLGHIYLKNGEYTLAQAALNRALSLAEQFGDGPLTSVIFSNLAELAASSSDYLAAERWYHRSLALAKRFDDREYLSLWNAKLAIILMEQGKLAEATTCICQALRIGRAMHNNPCIGAALVALSSMRITEAHRARHLPNVHKRLLLHAKDDVQRALHLEGLEADTREKGESVLAQVDLLLGQ